MSPLHIRAANPPELLLEGAHPQSFSLECVIVR